MTKTGEKEFHIQSNFEWSNKVFCRLQGVNTLPVSYSHTLKLKLNYLILVVFK